MNKVMKMMVAGVMLFVGAATSQAATVVWGGSTGEYTTGGNWVGGSVPNTNGGDTAVINAGAVTYTPGGDLPIHAGGKLQINGGSWTQAGGVAWIQMAGGTIEVTGGVFNQGTAGNMVKDATSAIIVSGGIANLNGNLVYENTATGAFTLSATGVVNVGGEFKPITNFTMSGGTLNSSLISFADGPGTISFSGGTVGVDGSGGNSGFYGGGGTKALNFTTSSTGILIFNTYTLAELATDGFLTNGTIQFNGTTDSSKFTATQVGGNVQVTLTAVPEPSTYALLAMGAVSLFALRRFRGRKA